MRTCTACGQSKPVTDFYERVDVNGKRRPRTRCKKCHNKLPRRMTERRREMGRRRDARRKELRQQAVAQG